MNIEIKKLTPELAEEYVDFFDTTPHDDKNPDHTCYCVNWCSVDQRSRSSDPSRNERKEMATQYVKGGKLQGYLAYLDNRIVGWCNANTKTECLNCFGWSYFMAGVNELELNHNEKVKSVYCFVVVPEMQRKGIAKQLLKYVCEDAAKDGFDYVEAYPEKDATLEYMHYAGFEKMYQDIGFTIYKETEEKLVMRKQLKGEK